MEIRVDNSDEMYYNLVGRVASGICSNPLLVGGEGGLTNEQIVTEVFDIVQKIIVNMGEDDEEDEQTSDDL